MDPIFRPILLIASQGMITLSLESQILHTLDTSFMQMRMRHVGGGGYYKFLAQIPH